MIKKIILGIFGLFMIGSFFQQSFAITVELPRAQGNPDIAVIGPEQISGDETTFFNTIQLVNKYLWFGLGVVCMVVLVWGGIQLITANGNDEKMKKTNKLLMGALIGILISILSYSVVRLVVNLFQ
ncbi:MAG: hypothetical protein PHR61_04665 [Candidatus Absconditabacteria bacterium]|nr:hypothetical protein [Candidatus Absconditabacteria bacterium]